MVANISEQKNLQRNLRINEIEKTLRQIFSSGKVISDEKDFLFQISDQYACTYRKAKEYLEIAKRRINVKEIETKL
jgi:stress response protein YsnF